MCKPSGDIINDQVKLCLFYFSYIGHANGCFQCIPNGTIQTWKELEDKFLECYYSNSHFVERKDAISNFVREESEL